MRTANYNLTKCVLGLSLQRVLASQMDELVAHHRPHRNAPLADPCANIDVRAMGRIIPMEAILPAGGLLAADQLQFLSAFQPPRPRPVQVDLRAKILAKKRNKKRPRSEDAESENQVAKTIRRSSRVKIIPQRVREDHPPVPAAMLHNLRSSVATGNT